MKHTAGKILNLAGLLLQALNSLAKEDPDRLDELTRRKQEFERDLRDLLKNFTAPPAPVLK